MKNILVLGGTGFVGRHVCEKLQRADGCVTGPTRRAANASAVQHLPLTEATALQFASPLFMTALSAMRNQSSWLSGQLASLPTSSS